jgi:uncharacterized protein (TIGR02001 family)
MRRFACLPLALALAASPALAAVEASLALVSDYVYRGWSQTQGRPVLQGGLGLSLPRGLHLDAWGSGVDFGEDGPHPARWEADLGAGLAGGDEEGLAWDLSFFSYRYPGSSSGYDYAEAVLALSRGGLGLELAWSPDEYAAGAEGGRLGLAAERELGADWGLRAGAGCSLWSRPASAALFAEDGRAWALDGELALGRALWNLDAELCLHATDGRGRRLAAGQGGTRLVLQVGRSFSRGE